MAAAGLSRIGQISMNARDLERGVAFYRDALGFEVDMHPGPGFGGSPFGQQGPFGSRTGPFDSGHGRPRPRAGSGVRPEATCVAPSGPRSPGA